MCYSTSVMLRKLYSNGHLKIIISYLDYAFKTRSYFK